MAHHDLAGLTVKYKNFIANNDAVLRMKKMNEEGKVLQASTHPSIFSSWSSPGHRLLKSFIGG